MPALAFPAIAGTHLPTPVGWKAELSSAWINIGNRKGSSSWFGSSPKIRRPADPFELKINRLRRSVENYYGAKLIKSFRLGVFVLSC